MASVELRNVWKIYGGKVEAVKDACWKCNDGEFFSILGPSGCGKSSTLRMVAGLEEISRGELLFDGQVVNALPPKDRNVAMVFESWALYPNMTVYENIAFPLRVRNYSSDAVDKKVREAAEFLDLTPILQTGVRRLSGGEMQRVSIGRAIVRNPKAFLFDEPLSNLDAALRVNMRIFIMQLHKDLGSTSIYVTHDQVEAMTMADRIVVLNRGHIEQVGSPLDLYNKPQSLFVAGFIGSPKMNLIEGAEATKHKAQTVGIRPEHIDIVSGKAPWTATILLTEHLGSDSFLHVDAGEAGRLIVRAPGDFTGKAGDKIGLKPDLARLHRFDAAGLAIAK